MSELKSYKMVDEYYCDDSFCVVPSDVYLKSEVDKTIAEQEETYRKEVEQLLMEIVELKTQVHDYAQGLYVIQARLEKFSDELRQQKYKRCRAMMMWCASRSVMLSHYGNEKDSDWFSKWKDKWKKLAEQFKEAEILSDVRAQLSEDK